MTKDINQWNNSVSCVDEISTDDLDDILDSLEMADDEFDAYVKEKCVGCYEEEDDDYADMAPCDYSGVCGGSSCSCYAKCHGWVK